MGSTENREATGRDTPAEKPPAGLVERIQVETGTNEANGLRGRATGRKIKSGTAHKIIDRANDDHEAGGESPEKATNHAKVSIFDIAMPAKRARHSEDMRELISHL